MGEQVFDGHGQVMVGVHQAAGAGDDAVAVVVGVAGEGHVEAVLVLDQPGHGMWRAAVHADLAVPVQTHEAKGRVDHRGQHLQRQPEALGDARPVVHAGAAQRVDREFQARAADGVEVDHPLQPADIGVDEIEALGGRGLQRLAVIHALDALETGDQQRIGALLNPFGHTGVGRAAVGGVVLEAAIARWVVRWRDDDAIGQPVGAATVVAEDRVGDRRGRCVARLAVGFAAAGVDARLDAVGREHFQRRDECRFGQRVGVHAHEQRAVDAFLAAVIADRLGGGEDMPLVEAALERGAAVPGGAERHLLRRVGRVRPVAVVTRHQARQVGQGVRVGQASCVGGDTHRSVLCEKAVRRPRRAWREANETPVGAIYPELRPHQRRRFHTRCYPACDATAQPGPCALVAPPEPPPQPPFHCLAARVREPVTRRLSHERRRTNPPARL